MAQPATINLSTIKRGDTYIADFYFTDTDGTTDISAITIDAQARKELDGTLWFDLKPEVVDAAKGHFRIHMTAEETRQITENPPGSFAGIYDIQFSWQGSSEIYTSTIVAGAITISKDVTYPSSLADQPPVVSTKEPTAQQTVNVFFSLDPGSPNYSDVVTVDELTPNQYAVAASMGLANINAIAEAGESAKAAKASELAAAQSAKSADQDAKLATAQASAAKASADLASQIAGTDDVAGAMGILAKVFGVHDVDIPFNDGTSMTHGFGQVTYTRLSETTDFNKSGVISTYAQDEAPITQLGIPLFGDLTNLSPYSDAISSIDSSKFNTEVVDGLNRYTLKSDTSTYNLLPLTQLASSDVGVTFKLKIKDLANIDSLRFRYGDNYVDVDSGFQEELNVFVPYTSGRKDLCSIYINGYGASPTGTGLTLEFVQVVDGQIPSAPRVPTSGTTVTRKPDICYFQSEGNLPKPGDPFYILVDLAETGLPKESYGRIVRSTDGSVSGFFSEYGQIAFGLRTTQGYRTCSADASQVFGKKRRIIFAYTGADIVIYCDGVRFGTLDAVDIDYTIGIGVYFGSTNGSSLFLNSYIKNFKIKHAVMTDDLAKAYGKWGD